jgi:cellulose synthase operon protein B
MTPVPGKDLLVLGSGADQPMFARWADAMPVRVDGDEFILNRPRGFVDSLLNASWLKPGMERSRLSQMLASEAPVSAVIQGIASPLGEGRAVVAIATTSARNFEDLTTILERSVYTEDVYGSVSVQQSGRFHSYKIRVPEYHTGSLGWRDAFYYWMSLYASLIPVVVLVLGLVLARKLERWINQLHAERLVPQHDWRQTRGSAQNEHPADAVGAEAP